MAEAAAADDVEAAFEGALAQEAQAAPPQMAAPPRHAASTDPEAPHGRDESGEPLAPYGTGRNGRPRIKPAGPGRGGKAKSKDEPRTREARPGETASKAAKLEPHDFAAELMEAGETIWFGGSMIAKVGPQVPVLGRFVPGDKLAATMAVFDLERPRLAAALNLAAQHDAGARKLASRLAAGEAGWALSVMFMVAPFAGAVAAIWQTTDEHNVLAERQLPGLAELAGRNAQALDRQLAKISQQMEAAQQELAAMDAEQMTTAAASTQEMAA